jgi:uncharacterized membrane protein
LANSKQVTQHAQAPANRNEQQAPEAIIQQTALQFVVGPMPSSKEMQGYEAVLPGAAERLFRIREREIDVFEHQVKNRTYMERRVVESDIQRANLGLAAGFIIAVGGLLITYQFGMHNQALLAGVFGLGDIITLVSVFVYADSSRRKERKERLGLLLEDKRNHGEEV